jgi:hypothetical protein
MDVVAVVTFPAASSTRASVAARFREPGEERLIALLSART